MQPFYIILTRTGCNKFTCAQGMVLHQRPKNVIAFRKSVGINVRFLNGILLGRCSGMPKLLEQEIIIGSHICRVKWPGHVVPIHCKV